MSPQRRAVFDAAYSALPDEPAPEAFALPRLRAERLTREHLPDLRRMHADGRMMAPLGGTRTEAETDAYLQRNLAHWAEHGFGIWILREPDEDLVIGRAGLRHLQIEGVDEVELAYALFPRWWGQGLATVAARACVTIGREWLGLPSVAAVVLAENLASRRVLQKAAMAEEREVWHAGRPHLLYRTD